MKKKVIMKKIFGGQILVIFSKKCDFWCILILTPPLFRPETDKLPKKIFPDLQVSQILAKKVLVTIRPKMREKIQKVDPHLHA